MNDTTQPKALDNSIVNSVIRRTGALRVTLWGAFIIALPTLAACASGDNYEPPSGQVDSALCDIGESGCITCGEMFANDNTCGADQLCPESFEIHEAAQQCMCDLCPDECSERCGDEAEPFSTECVGCILERCPTTAEACANDWPDET